MSTNNSVNVSLSGQTGTGNFAGSNSPTITTPTIATGLAASGSATNDFSASTGAFKTSSGANTLEGATTINDATTPSLTTAAGKTNTGFLEVLGKTSGGFKITTADATLETVTLNLDAQTSGNATLSVPDQAGSNKTVAWLESPSFTTPTLGAATATSIAFSPTTDGIVGTTTNDSASTGFVGEYVYSNLPYASSVTPASSSTPSNVTSISLTAGDWDVSGSLSFLGAGATTLTFALCTLSTTSTGQQDPSENTYGAPTTLSSSSTNFSLSSPQLRTSLAMTTTIYLNCAVIYSGTAIDICGIISARRVR